MPRVTAQISIDKCDLNNAIMAGNEASFKEKLMRQVRDELLQRIDAELDGVITFHHEEIYKPNVLLLRADVYIGRV